MRGSSSAKLNLFTRLSPEDVDDLADDSLDYHGRVAVRGLKKPGIVAHSLRYSVLTFASTEDDAAHCIKGQRLYVRV